MDLFPKDAVARNQPASPELANKWRSWIADPINRASLIQTGIALLQPVASGQSVIGHIGTGVGAGLGLRGKYEAAEAKTRDAEQQRNLDAQRVQLEAQRLDESKKQNSAENSYRTGALALDARKVAADEKRAQSGLTLSQMLAQKNRETAATERDQDQFVRWFTEKKANDDLFGVDTSSPNYQTSAMEEWSMIQSAAEQSTGGQPIGSSKTGKSYTPEELEFSAKKYGVTVEEAKKLLGIN